MGIKVKVANSWHDSPLVNKVSADKLVGKLERAHGFSNDGAIDCTDNNCSYSCIGNVYASCNTCVAYCSTRCGDTCNHKCNNSCLGGGSPN